MDSFTLETVRGMVRYIRDDGRIARHVGCTIEAVRSVRERQPMTASELIARRMPAGVGPGIGEDQFARDARRGSERLAEAMARAREGSI